MTRQVPVYCPACAREVDIPVRVIGVAVKPGRLSVTIAADEPEHNCRKERRNAK